jgi:hypothetical protein
VTLHFLLLRVVVVLVMTWAVVVALADTVNLLPKH